MYDPATLRKRYERIAALLRDARAAIPATTLGASHGNALGLGTGHSRGVQDDLDRFLGVGEYELAWNALADAASLHDVSDRAATDLMLAAALLVPVARMETWYRDVDRALHTVAALRSALVHLPALAHDDAERADIVSAERLWAHQT